ncbi:hypothetical protein ACROYT_G036489 [Oculina patagonica]
MSPHIVSLVIMAALAVTVWTLDKVVFEVEVKRNNTSIEWDKKLSDKRSQEFKEMSLAVRNQLRKDLDELQGISEIKVKKFMKMDGNTSQTFCEFECKVNPKHVRKEDIENALNMTIDIGAAVEITYTQISMSLSLSSLAWIEAYNDHNSSEYKNLTAAIGAALSEVYQDTEDVVGFEIVSVSEAPDDSLVVEYIVLVDPDSDLKKNDLEETIKEFTNNGSFGKLLTGVKKQQQPQTESEDDNEEDKPLVGLVVFAAVIMCLVILTFLVVIVRQNWKYIKEHSPEARFESYQSREGDGIETVTVTEQSNTVPAITVESVVLELCERPV